VLSCRTIQDEVYHEMTKEVQKIQEDMASRWPLPQPLEFPSFERHPMLKELVVEVPFLPWAMLINSNRLVREQRSIVFSNLHRLYVCVAEPVGVAATDLAAASTISRHGHLQ
jgi:hypothetical protein